MCIYPPEVLARLEHAQLLQILIKGNGQRELLPSGESFDPSIIHPTQHDESYPVKYKVPESIQATVMRECTGSFQVYYPIAA
jgi:hypothetical protein